ncbi:MAG: GspH/FimT family pseudopilin [Pseudomonadota bacterium]
MMEKTKVRSMRFDARGFTLVELMVTLSIAALLLTLAVPSFTEMLANNRMITNVNQFVVAMNFARSEAIKRNAAIDVTANGGDWKNGWTITVTSDGTVLNTFEALAGNVSFTSAGSHTTFQYQASGRLTPAAGDSLTLCDDRTGETGRRITLTNTGRVTTANNVCA